MTNKQYKWKVVIDLLANSPSVRLYCETSAAINPPPSIPALHHRCFDDRADTGRFVVAHERFVEPGALCRMARLPTTSAIVTEAFEVSAEVRSVVTQADVARRLLQVGIDLDLIKKTQPHSSRCIICILEKKYFQLVFPAKFFSFGYVYTPITIISTIDSP